MNTQLLNVYLCTFRTGDLKNGPTREIKAAASTFGQASFIAKEISSNWDDYSAYELVSIHLIGVIATMV